MYKINDTVIYGTQGVCKIVDISERVFMGNKKEYYVLKPVNNTGTTLFAPADNETIMSKMRRILSKEEIQKLIDSLTNEESIWIDDKNERKEKFRNILNSGKHEDLIQLIKTIWLQKQKYESEGKKLHLTDERFFKEAEQLLYDEFQYVLKINKEDLITYIFKTNN